MFIAFVLLIAAVAIASKKTRTDTVGRLDLVGVRWCRTNFDVHGLGSARQKTVGRLSVL
jgi:hypothetical protein